MLSTISKPLTFNQLQSNSEVLAELQTLLKEKGFYHLKIDGVWGQGTETAIESVANLLNLNNFDKKLIGKTFISKLTSYNPEKDTETELDVSLTNTAHRLPVLVRPCMTAIVRPTQHNLWINARFKRSALGYDVITRLSNKAVASFRYKKQTV